MCSSTFDPPMRPPSRDLQAEQSYPAFRKTSQPAADSRTLTLPALRLGLYLHDLNESTTSNAGFS